VVANNIAHTRENARDTDVTMASSMDSNHPFIDATGATYEEYGREQSFVRDATLTVGRNASLTLGTDSLIVLGAYDGRC
jgi:hypothetical protein